MADPSLDETILASLPKAELHLHLDGSMRPATAVELAAEVGIELGAAEAPARLIAPPRCRDHAELLTYFDLPVALMQTESALRRVTSELVTDLAADGTRYAEIRWAPRLHLAAGLSVRAVIAAVIDGVGDAARRNGGSPTIGLIVTAMRSHPPAANVELARIAGEFADAVVGFDLAGPEAAYPSPPHAAAFRAAEDAGLALTAHAGEEAGADRIRDALGLGVRRIAHGATTFADPELVALVRQRDVTLDLCPTSNVQVGIVDSLAAHPIGGLHRAGVSVTISTDDRTIANVTLSQEISRTAQALALTPTEVAEIAVNAFRRGFVARGTRLPLIAEAERAWAAWAADVDPVGGVT